MIVKKITKFEFLKILSNYLPQIDVMSNKYAAWNAISKVDFEKMKFIGKLDLSNDKSDKVNLEDYWSIDFPIAINYFPYSDSDIYQLNKNLYFIYRDFGGHVPELRCRFFNLDFLILD